MNNAGSCRVLTLLHLPIMKQKDQSISSQMVIDPECPWRLPRGRWEFPKYAYKKSVAEWKALLGRATQGDPEAEYLVAVMYDDGCKDRRGRILVRCSAAKALAWYRRSAEHGFAYAQSHLGVLLSDGTGMKKDPREALVWMKRALRGENTSSCVLNNIAITYRENGYLRQAVSWFRKAVALGDDGAFVELGIHYYWGKGISTDHEEAVRCFRRATRGSNMSECERDDAFFYLGIAFLEGKGVRRSLQTAQKHLERANKDNDHPAARRILKELARV